MAFSAVPNMLPMSTRLSATRASPVSAQPYGASSVLGGQQPVFLGGSFGAAPGVSEPVGTSRRTAGSYSGPSNMAVGSQPMPTQSLGSQPLFRQMNATGSASSLMAPTMTPVTPAAPQAAAGVTASYQPPIGSVNFPGDGFASSGGTPAAAAPQRQRLQQQQQQQQAGYATADPASAASAQDEALQRTRLRMTGNEELLQAEIESLRRSLAIQEDRIVQLTKELQAAHESERKLCAEAEVARSESARLTEEVRLERMGREQAEAAVTEMRLSYEAALQEKKAPSPERGGLSSRNGNASSRNGSIVSGRRPPADRRGTYLGRSDAKAEQDRSHRDTKDSIGTPSNIDSRPQSASTTRESAAGPSSSRRGSNLKAAPAKDEIDVRLREFLERSESTLSFRRLNRGWYAFRRADEKGPLSNDRTVELSITNGKLMAKLEPTTHDAGWNNGKLGPIERFVAHMTM